MQSPGRGRARRHGREGRAPGVPLGCRPPRKRRIQYSAASRRCT